MSEDLGNIRTQHSTLSSVVVTGAPTILESTTSLFTIATHILNFGHAASAAYVLTRAVTGLCVGPGTAVTAILLTFALRTADASPAK